MPNTKDKKDSEFCISGIVVQGDQLGRQLGFPTANLHLPENVSHLPKMGVFAVIVNLNGNHFNGICNVGFRPTFHGKRFTVEVHLIGFSGDLYGKEIEVRFIQKLRNEQKFSNLEELKRQISLDREKAIRLFAERD